MKRQFVTLDVFTDKKLAGNPLAVVLDAQGLDTAQMQAIAREFNLSETVFVLAPDNPAHSAKLRIFTPGAELPFAGHPTVGAAVLLAVRKVASPETEQDAIIVLEENIGAVRVGVRLHPGKAPFAEFDLPALSENIGNAPGRDRLCTALELTHGEIGFENHKPSLWSAGMRFVFVPVRDLETVAKVKLNLAVWNDCLKGYCGEVFVYCRESVHQGNHFHGRMFAPGIGVLEDAATGAAAAAFSGVIQHFDDLPAGIHRFHVEQGYEMGRPSRIDIEIETANGKVHAARVGGHAVFVSEGVLEI